MKKTRTLRFLALSWVLFPLAVIADEPANSVPLFDGKSLNGWKATNFGGEGEVYVDEGVLILEMGSDLTGITTTRLKELPRMNYEIVVEAKRLVGGDFFCGLTFPVNEACCSLIVGGWGGGLVGLSSLDTQDASENETASWQDLDDDRWYRIRLRVEPKRIQAWIDDRQVVDVDTEGKEIDVRPEVRLSRPLGIASWRTTAAIRQIILRPIQTDESSTSKN